MPRYCCPIEIFFVLVFIEMLVKFKTAWQDRQAGESVCWIVQVGFEPRPCRSQSRCSLTTRPHCRLKFVKWPKIS